MASRPTGLERKESAFPWIPGLICAGVFIATFLAYSGSLRHGFVWDDDFNVINNLHIRSLGWSQLRWMSTTTMGGPYQPLTLLSFALDYRIWGLDPFGFHLSNVLLHCLNAVLVVLLARRLIKSAEPNLGWLCAAFAALLFSIHPLRAESVAWVSERKDVLFGFFYLGAILLWLQQRKRLALAAFLLSLLSKGMAVSLPVALVILDAYLCRGWPRLRDKLPFFAAAALFGCIGLIGQAHVSAFVSGLDWLARLQIAGRAPVFYLAKTLYPARLLPIYELPIVTHPMPAGFLLGTLATVALTAASLLAAGRLPALSAAWLSYLVMLMPASGLAQFGIQAAADRYSYIPCLVWAILAGAGLGWLLDRAGRLKPVLVLGSAVLFSGLSWTTRRQVRYWRNAETLWSHALAAEPGLVRAHDALGDVYLARGQAEQAVASYQEALRLDERSWVARLGLAQAYARLGRQGEALQQLQAALHVDDKQAGIHAVAADILGQQGRWDEAAASWRRVLALDPDFNNAHINLGAALEHLGRADEALQEFRSAVAADPGSCMAHNNLAIALAKGGDLPGALEQARQAVQLDPQDALARRNLDILNGVRGP